MPNANSSSATRMWLAPSGTAAPSLRTRSAKRQPAIRLPIPVCVCRPGWLLRLSRRLAWHSAPPDEPRWPCLQPGSSALDQTAARQSGGRSVGDRATERSLCGFGRIQRSRSPSGHEQERLPVLARIQGRGARPLLGRAERLSRAGVSCPSSDAVRQVGSVRNGGSGSSGLKIMRLARDAASGG